MRGNLRSTFLTICPPQLRPRARSHSWAGSVPPAPSRTRRCPGASPVSVLKAGIGFAGCKQQIPLTSATYRAHTTYQALSCSRVHEGGDLTLTEIEVSRSPMGQWPAGRECLPEPVSFPFHHRRMTEDSRSLGGRGELREWVTRGEGPGTLLALCCLFLWFQC